MITKYITLQKETPLDCAKDNPRYHLVLGFYLGVLEVVFCIMTDDFHLAKSIFSQVMTEHLPTDYYSLDNINYKEVLSGEFADNLSYIYEAMLSLWMDVQDESLPDAEELDYNEVKNRLFDIRSALLELYQLTVKS